MNQKVRNLILFVIFGSLLFSYNSYALKLTEEYIGKLEIGGTDFDNFITNSGKTYEINKNNPAVKKIYDVCLYDTRCKIEAILAGDEILSIYSAKNMDASLSKTINTNQQNLNNYNDDGKTLSIYGVKLTDTYEQIIENGIKNGYEVYASTIPERYNGKVIRISNSNYMPLPLEDVSNIPGTSVKINQDIVDASSAWHDLVGNNLYKADTFSLVIYRGNHIDKDRQLTAYFYKDINNNNILLSLVTNKNNIIYEVLVERYGNPKTEIIKMLGGSLEGKLFKINNDYVYLNHRSPIIFYYNDLTVKKFTAFAKKYKFEIQEKINRKINEEIERKNNERNKYKMGI